ncbi:MAG: hypothetical protein ACOCZL_02545 [Bacteroidota bacterium]
MNEKNPYTDEMREKSNYDLQQIIKSYPGEEKKKVIAALRELERRDVLYSDEQKLLEDLEDEENDHEDNKQKPVSLTPFSMLRDPNIVEDFNAPRLFSLYAIRFFAIIFSTFFGGILLSINLNRLGKKNEIFYVIAFSFLYSIVVYQVITYFPENMTTATLILNLIGSLILEEFFWKRYIGKHFKFRRQPIGGVLLIGFGISLLLGYLLLSGA